MQAVGGELEKLPGGVLDERSMNVRININVCQSLSLASSRTYDRFKDKLGVGALRRSAREETAKLGMRAETLLVGPLDVGCGEETTSVLLASVKRTAGRTLKSECKDVEPKVGVRRPDDFGAREGVEPFWSPGGFKALNRALKVGQVLDVLARPHKG